MRKGKYFLVGMAALVASGLVISGCALNFYKQSPRSKKKIRELETKVDELERLRAEEREKFAQVKKKLEKKLKGQIADEQVSLKMREGSLVIVLSDEILFDSGKAKIKKEASPVLDKVAKVINREVPEKNIGIGGHTDNVPITYSNWKSNWELSTARATTVLHHLKGEGIPAERLSATGYGEHRPAASNDTPEGRARNRRVEIVILPEFVEERAAEESGRHIK